MIFRGTHYFLLTSNKGGNFDPFLILCLSPLWFCTARCRQQNLPLNLSENGPKIGLTISPKIAFKIGPKSASNLVLESAPNQTKIDLKIGPYQPKIFPKIISKFAVGVGGPPAASRRCGWAPCRPQAVYFVIMFIKVYLSFMSFVVS
jgi:hypothetical protein